MKINKWIIYTEIGIKSIPYILTFPNEEINDNEIAMCIQEQIYGEEK